MRDFRNRATGYTVSINKDGQKTTGNTITGSVQANKQAVIEFVNEKKLAKLVTLDVEKKTKPNDNQQFTNQDLQKLEVYLVDKPNNKQKSNS